VLFHNADLSELNCRDFYNAPQIAGINCIVHANIAITLRYKRYLSLYVALHLMNYKYRIEILDPFALIKECFSAFG